MGHRDQAASPKSEKVWPQGIKGTRRGEPARIGPRNYCSPNLNFPVGSEQL